MAATVVAITISSSLAIAVTTVTMEWIERLQSAIRADLTHFTTSRRPRNALS